MIVNVYNEWLGEIEVDLKHRLTIITGSEATGKSELLNAIEVKYPGSSKDYIKIDIEQALKHIVPQFSSYRELSSNSFVVKKNGRDIYDYELSEGELYILMAIDYIIGGLDRGEKTAFVDDVEQNLSIEWQRTVLPRLFEFFSDCKFIITTKSPFLISSIKEEYSLISLHGRKNNKLCYDIDSSHDLRVYGMDISTVLNLIIEGCNRDPEVNQKFYRLFDCLAREETMEAENILFELRKFMYKYDPNMIKAEFELHKLKLKQGGNHDS